MDGLASDLKQYILQFLDYDDIPNLRLLNKTWLRLYRKRSKAIHDLHRSKRYRNLQISHVIGSGFNVIRAAGVFLLCQDLRTHDEIVAKVIRVEEQEYVGGKELQNQFNTLSKQLTSSYLEDMAHLSEQTILLFWCVYVLFQLIGKLLLEHCPLGNVKHVLQEGTHLSEIQIASILAQILLGLDQLHQHKIAHHQIEASHILLNSKGQAKLSAWVSELTRRLIVSHHKLNQPFWIAPEVVTATVTSFYKSDIWSVGITAIELAERDPPLANLGARAIFKIPNQPPPRLKNPNLWSEEFNDFVAQCLSMDPNQRPDTSQLLQHPFVKKGLETLKSGNVPPLSSSHKENLLDDVMKRLSKTHEQMSSSNLLYMDEVRDFKAGHEFTIDIIHGCYYFEGESTVPIRTIDSNISAVTGSNTTVDTNASWNSTNSSSSSDSTSRTSTMNTSTTSMSTHTTLTSSATTDVSTTDSLRSFIG